MNDITLKIPSEVIMKILRRIPQRQLRELQGKIQREEVKSVPAGYLLKLAGIASIGGDAVKDTEEVWQ